MPLHGLRLDIDDAILKRKTKDIIRYLHERLKKVISMKAKFPFSKIINHSTGPEQIYLFVVAVSGVLSYETDGSWFWWKRKVDSASVINEAKTTG